MVATLCMLASEIHPSRLELKKTVGHDFKTLLSHLFCTHQVLPMLQASIGSAVATPNHYILGQPILWPKKTFSGCY